MSYKPQLLSNDKFDVSTIDFENGNWYMSIKRDGVRLANIDADLKTRRLKPFRNCNMPVYFGDFLDKAPKDVILEGEVYKDGIPLRTISGILNSKADEIPDGTKLYIFGLYDPELTFEQRYHWLQSIFLKTDLSSRVVLVEQIPVKTYEQVEAFYNECLRLGYEGAVLMNGDGKYKCGRFTIKQGLGYKMKPHEEIDLEIIGVTERMENLNESTKDELGHSVKRNTVDDKKPTGIASCFICLMPDGETETKVNIGGTEEYRKEIWDNQSDYVGQFAVIESMVYGTKDKLRYPQLVGLKHSHEK